jgi:hypothetical protein
MQAERLRSSFGSLRRDNADATVAFVGAQTAQTIEMMSLQTMIDSALDRLGLRG